MSTPQTQRWSHDPYPTGPMPKFNGGRPSWLPVVAAVVPVLFLIVVGVLLVVAYAWPIGGHR